jgi:hypothetical protein
VAKIPIAKSWGDVSEYADGEIVGEWGVHECLCRHCPMVPPMFQITHVATGIRPPRAFHLSREACVTLANALIGWDFKDAAGFYRIQNSLKGKLSLALKEVGAL